MGELNLLDVFRFAGIGPDAKQADQDLIAKRAQNQANNQPIGKDLADKLASYNVPAHESMTPLQLHALNPGLQILLQARHATNVSEPTAITTNRNTNSNTDSILQSIEHAKSLFPGQMQLQQNQVTAGQQANAFDMASRGTRLAQGDANLKSTILSQDHQALINSNQETQNTLANAALPMHLAGMDLGLQDQALGLQSKAQSIAGNKSEQNLELLKYLPQMQMGLSTPAAEAQMQKGLIMLQKIAAGHIKISDLGEQDQAMIKGLWEAIGKIKGNQNSRFGSKSLMLNQPVQPGNLMFP